MLPLPALPGVRHAHHELPTGVRLHVAEAGDAAAPAVLAVHGWPQHWWMWRGVIPALAERHRVICPDLRGFGWSGQPDDRDFSKARIADDMLVHPWTSRATALLNLWRLLYQYPLAAPVLGPALVRDGRVVRRALAGAMGADDAAVFADVLREPARAHASSLLYRHFQLRELPRLAAGRFAGARIEMPVKLLFGRNERVQAVAQLAGVEHHVPRAEVELVDGGHLLPDQRPELVADRARAWFA